jgi:exonuclease VII large subunit
MPVPETVVQPCAAEPTSTGSPAGLLTADQVVDVRRPVQAKELLLQRLAQQSAELNVVLAAILRAMCERKQYQDQQLELVRKGIVKVVRKRIKENQIRIGTVFGALRDAVVQRVATNSGVLIECQTRMLLGEVRNEQETATIAGATETVGVFSGAATPAAPTTPGTPQERCEAISAAAAQATATAVASERVTINFPDTTQAAINLANSLPDPAYQPIEPVPGNGIEAGPPAGEVPVEGEYNG